MKCELTLNFDTTEWSLKTEGDGHWVDVFIGFTSANNVTQFDNLSFFYSVTVNGDHLQTASFPPEGQRYVATDQPYLVVDRVMGVRADDAVSLSLTVNNAGIEYTNIKTFVVPRPEQPDPTWIWNDEDKCWDYPEWVELTADETFQQSSTP